MLSQRSAQCSYPDPVTRTEKRMAVVCLLAKALVAPFARVEIAGRQSLADVGPFVAGANHRSLADLFVGLVAFRHLGVFPSILFNRRFLPGPLSRMAEACGVILVDEGGATKAAVKAVSDGACIMVMPEGGLFFDREAPRRLGPIKPGIARIARLGSTPMVPIAVDGTQKVWPKGSYPRLHRKRPTVVVTVGEPTPSEFPSTGDEHDDQGESDKLMAMVSAMLPE